MSHPVSASSPATSHNIRAFGLTSLFNDTASEMAYWVLPAFLTSIGAGPAKLGVIEGIAESVASFAKFFSGYLVANAVKPLLAIATSWWHVLLIRFADRFAKGMRGTARDVMAAESLEENRLGSAYGFIQAMDSAGAIAGPLIALLLLPHYGLRGVFLTAAAPGAICILVAVFGIRETGQQTEPARAPSTTAAQQNGSSDSTASSSPAGWRVHLPGSFYYVLLTVTLFSLGNSSDMFLVLRAGSLGIPARRAPLLGLVFNITYTLVSWPAGRFSDRFSRRVIAAAGYLVFAVVYFVFGLAPSTRAIWLAMACYGLFYALTNPVLKALVVETVSDPVRGRALGVYFSVTSIAMLLASVITGELWKHFGAHVPFYLSAAIAVVSALLLLAAKRPQRSP